MRAETPTLLPLAEFAKILGLDPLHFAGGYSALRPAPSCSDVWYQYDWQNANLVSRDQCARVIYEAEENIANVLNYWPAPTWLHEEIEEYPRLYRRDLVSSGKDLRGDFRGLRLRYGYVIEGGQRTTELIASDVQPVFSDADGDGFDEVATFTIPNVSTTLDPCEVKGYYKEYDDTDDDTRTNLSSTGADPAWEIRPMHVSRSGTILTIRCNSWLLFKPQLHENLNPAPIDADDMSNYVTGIDFYREYTDPSSQVEFGWTNCSQDCQYTTQSGCLRIKSAANGLVVPIPSIYNATDGTFTPTDWLYAREPDVVRVWYRAGITESNAVCNRMPEYLARIVTMLAVSRLNWPICTCSNKNNLLLSDELRKDMAEVQPDHSYMANIDVLTSPFGTRVGEVRAWKQIAKARGRARGLAVYT